LVNSELGFGREWSCYINIFLEKLRKNMKCLRIADVLSVTTSRICLELSGSTLLLSESTLRKELSRHLETTDVPF
jgi:hypothetical protein